MFMTGSTLGKPIKDGELYLWEKGRHPIKLIRYEKPHCIGHYCYEGLYWWLKPYDAGMPFANDGYKDEGKAQPCEAVTFVE